MKIVLLALTFLSIVSCATQENNTYRDSTSEADKNAKALVLKMQKENPTFDYVDHYNQQKKVK